MPAVMIMGKSSVMLEALSCKGLGNLLFITRQLSSNSKCCTATLFIPTTCVARPRQTHDLFDMGFASRCV